MKKLLFFILTALVIFPSLAADQDQDKKKVGIFVYGPVAKIDIDMVDNMISSFVKETGDKYVVTEHTADFNAINNINQYYQMDDPKDNGLLEIANYFREDYVIVIMMVTQNYKEVYMGARLIDVEKGESARYWDCVIDRNLNSLRDTSRHIASELLDIKNGME